MNKKEGTVRGYKVKRSVRFKNGVGFAVGGNQAATFPFATWKFSEDKGRKTFQSGQFFMTGSANAAELVFNKRVDEYRKDHPGLGEKYNQPSCLGEQSAQRTTSLAAAEMSSEGNYNMIDGIPNNGFEQKPSIIDQLREYKPKPPEKADGAGKPEKTRKQGDIEL